MAGAGPALSLIMPTKLPIAAATPDILNEAFNGMTDGFCIIQMAFEVERAVDCGFVSINHSFANQTGLRDALGRSFEVHAYRVGALRH